MRIDNLRGGNESNLGKDRTTQYASGACNMGVMNLVGSFNPNAIFPQINFASGASWGSTLFDSVYDMANTWDNTIIAIAGRKALGGGANLGIVALLDVVTPSYYDNHQINRGGAVTTSAASAIISYSDASTNYLLYYDSINEDIGRYRLSDTSWDDDWFSTGVGAAITLSGSTNAKFCKGVNKGIYLSTGAQIVVFYPGTSTASLLYSVDAEWEIYDIKSWNGFLVWTEGSNKSKQVRVYLWNGRGEITDAQVFERAGDIPVLISEGDTLSLQLRKGRYLFNGSGFERADITQLCSTGDLDGNYGSKASMGGAIGAEHDGVVVFNSSTQDLYRVENGVSFRIADLSGDSGIGVNTYRSLVVEANSSIFLIGKNNSDGKFYVVYAGIDDNWGDGNIVSSTIELPFTCRITRVKIRFGRYDSSATSVTGTFSLFKENTSNQEYITETLDGGDIIDGVYVITQILDNVDRFVWKWAWNVSTTGTPLVIDAIDIEYEPLDIL